MLSGDLESFSCPIIKVPLPLLIYDLKEKKIDLTKSFHAVVLVIPSKPLPVGEVILPLSSKVGGFTLP